MDDDSGYSIELEVCEGSFAGGDAGVLSSRSLFPTYFVDIFGPEYATNGLTVLAESS